MYVQFTYCVYWGGKLFKKDTRIKVSYKHFDFSLLTRHKILQIHRVFLLLKVHIGEGIMEVTKIFLIIPLIPFILLELKEFTRTYQIKHSLNLFIQE